MNLISYVLKQKLINIYASALLVDNKIKFWRVGESQKTSIADFYKDYYYTKSSMTDDLNKPNVRVVNKIFSVKNDRERNRVFMELAPNWFANYELTRNYKGSLPY